MKPTDQDIEKLIDAKEYDCDTCGDTGEVSTDEMDRDGNWQRGVGTERCQDCQDDEPADFSGASEGDR